VLDVTVLGSFVATDTRSRRQRRAPTIDDGANVGSTPVLNHNMVRSSYRRFTEFGSAIERRLCA